jgi:hypothetical protein
MTRYTVTAPKNSHTYEDRSRTDKVEDDKNEFDCGRIILFSMSHFEL